jgi:hypothetical protein
MRYPHLTARHELARPRHCPGAGRRIAEARVPPAMTDPRRERDVDETTYEALAQEASLEMVPGVSLAAMELSFNLIRAANRLQRDLEITVTGRRA